MTRMKNLFAVGLFLIFTTHAYAASPDKVKVEKAYHDWCVAISTAKGNAHEVVKFYAPGAVLLPTLSAKILSNYHHGLNAYYADLTKRPNIKCSTEKLTTHLYGKYPKFAVNTGYYTFSYTDTDGKTKEIPARFSFVYQKVNRDWLIVNQHSSVMP